MDASLKNIFDPVRRPESRGTSAWLLAPLLVAALFVCHGAVGGADQLVVELAPPTSSDALPITGASADSHSVGHSVDHSTPHVDYVVAALFAGLCASVLGRLFGVLRTSTFNCSFVRRPIPGVARLSVSAARPPTTPEVQVFRL